MGKKTRVYELARELGRNSKEILDLLAESGVRDKNHMSALEDNVVRFIKNRFAEKDGRKEPEGRSVGPAQPAPEKEKPAVRETPPRERPKPKPRPLPLPRPIQARGGRPGPGAGRPRSAAPSDAGHRRGPERRPQTTSGRPETAHHPPSPDRQERRWTPAGLPSAGQRPVAKRHWPTQVAPTMPAAQSRSPGRPGRPGPTTAPAGAVGRTSPGAAGGRGRPFERPRQIRPSVRPAPPSAEPGRATQEAQETSRAPRPEAAPVVRPPESEKTATQTAERGMVRPEAPDVAVRGPQEALESGQEQPVAGAAPVGAGAAASGPARSAEPTPEAPRRPEDKGAAPSTHGARPAGRPERGPASRPVAQQPREARAARHVGGGQPTRAGQPQPTPGQPVSRPPAARQPAAHQPAAGAAAGAPQRPGRARGPAQAPAQGPAESKRPSAGRPPRPEARREYKGESREQKDRRTERRLELIKGGKGAEKLREARAEAIIRARMPRRPAGAQAGAAAAARRREHPKRERKIALPAGITVGELAEKLGIASADVIKSLMGMGVLATINQEIDFDAASLVADEHGFDVEPFEQKEAREFGIEDVPDAPEALKPRPPVVTVLGHVDHGKTSLLDAIRQTNVTAQEAGGITQHIGAYQVELGGRKITFIDTPGHEAFTAMRARGAQVTDIAVLVVAADDGVMPQTVEAINHARAAKVPIVVAINKIDKANAQPDRVKQELAQQGLVPEEWGGDTVTVEVSALRKQGIEDLLEMILLVADMRELKANPDRPAKGTVIEARLDRGRGPVATVLVEKGTLRVGDSIVAGEVFGKVRAMADDQGRPVEAAGPSRPVEVLGFSEVPQAGDVLHVVSEDKLAKQLAARRSERKRAEEVQGARTVSLDALFGKIQEGEVKELNLIIKADVQGSVEALRQSLENLSTDEVKVNVIHAGVGAITESDVMLASASGAIIIGFQVRPDVNAKKMAERDRVDIRLYRIIYDATADVKAAMEGLLEPERHEVTVGRADVMATFHVPKVGLVAGCKVSDGKITRDSLARVLRDNVVVHEGKIESLRRFKDDVSEVATGYECGIGLENFHDIKEGDVIEAFKVEETRREL
ncbi:MAG: translation initiation factor IF-2 [Bacillota bacterium]|nr:translation initiation factor IF-2 [Bacillota bacterium]